MAKLLRMCDYIRPSQALSHARLPGQAAASGLRLSMDDILGRDYCRPEHIIHGILRIREILDRHLGPECEWQGLLLDLLSEACPEERHGRPDSGGLHSAQRLQACIEEHIQSHNALELGAAVVILKLMEHSPAARKLLGDAPRADPLASG